MYMFTTVQCTHCTRAVFAGNSTLTCVYINVKDNPEWKMETVPELTAHSPSGHFYLILKLGNDMLPQFDQEVWLYWALGTCIIIYII